MRARSFQTKIIQSRGPQVKSHFHFVTLPSKVMTSHYRLLQNKPTGAPGRTPADIENVVVDIYRESFEAERPKSRRYWAVKVGRLLDRRHHYRLSRKTVWDISRRRGVWEPSSTEKDAVQRFELWQIDVRKREPAVVGEVYGVPLLDDYCRYVLGLRSFPDQRSEDHLADHSSGDGRGRHTAGDGV